MLCHSSRLGSAGGGRAIPNGFLPVRTEHALSIDRVPTFGVSVVKHLDDYALGVVTADDRHAPAIGRGGVPLNGRRVSVACHGTRALSVGDNRRGANDPHVILVARVQDNVAVVSVLERLDSCLTVGH
jgi:hypothetical protein